MTNEGVNSVREAGIQGMMNAALDKMDAIKPQPVHWQIIYKHDPEIEVRFPAYSASQMMTTLMEIKNALSGL